MCCRNRRHPTCPENIRPDIWLRHLLRNPRLENCDMMPFPRSDAAADTAPHTGPEHRSGQLIYRMICSIGTLRDLHSFRFHIGYLYNQCRINGRYPMQSNVSDHDSKTIPGDRKVPEDDVPTRVMQSRRSWRTSVKDASGRKDVKDLEQMYI